MKRFLKITLMLFSVVFVMLCLLLFLMFEVERVMPWNEESYVRPTLEIGGLAPLPEKRSEVKVWTRGSLFARTVIVEFQSEPNDLDVWIKKSKNLQNRLPRDSSGIQTYQIYPGEDGTFGGTVVINRKENLVRIRMSTS